MPDVAQLKVKSESLLKEIPTLMPGSSLAGILTHKTHLASVGEWQKQISQASMFLYFSMTCLLHQFPKELITDLTGAGVIVDAANLWFYEMKVGPGWRSRKD